MDTLSVCLVDLDAVTGCCQHEPVRVSVIVSKWIGLEWYVGLATLKFT